MEQPMIFRLRAGLLNNGVTLLNAADVDPGIESATPPEFGGKEGFWSPETLLLGAAAGCFINTFQFFAKRMKFEFDGITCEAEGTVERVEGKSVFTGITVYPTIMIADESLRPTILDAVEKAHRYCLVSNSLKCPVQIRENVLIASIAE
ncbi:MAG: OsmC family protein [Bacteroidota bacterium]|jgi:organic hydroperoxide reductase OsmC/OhrA|nr:OsmC family protein [Saprospiraceae bacterium]